MLVFICLIILLTLPLSISYNIDVKYPIIFEDPSINIFNPNSTYQSSSFGFSVLLVPEFMKLDSRLLVGAPKGRNSEIKKAVKEPGLVYECSLLGKCKAISPTSDSSPDIVVNQIGMFAKVIQDGGCFGMSIVALHPTLIKICAPRTKINLFKPFTNEYEDTMQGMCYYYSKSSDNSFLQIETESLTTYNFSSDHWYNPEYGFSQHVAVGISHSVKPNIQEKGELFIKPLLQNVSMITGNPNNEIIGSINIIKENKRKTLLTRNEGLAHAEIGYAVTSGKYFRKNEILFASGAPTWKFTGMVSIINSSGTDLSTIRTLHGDELGEYFGASLTSGDFNNDGYDDLVVGSPLYGDDNGKITIYLGNQHGFQEYDSMVIKGLVKGAQFGYSLSCGDLDRDGFFDLIVGAPWEESGVIYVYNGHSELDDKKTLLLSQKITARQISMSIRGFGFSISNIVDVDNNRFPDVAVGAYKSDHALILRGKPVEKMDINFKGQPSIIKRNMYTISLEFCLKNYKSLDFQISRNYTFVITVDKNHKRFTYDSIVWIVHIISRFNVTFYYRYSGQPQFTPIFHSVWNGCISTAFKLKNNNTILIDPVEISLTWEMNSYQTKQLKNDTHPDNFCKWCPIRYQGRESKPIKLSLPFDIGCGGNKLCNPNISITTALRGVSKNNTWEIGSGDISIEVKFQNHGEAAYAVTAEFFIPRGIHLRNMLSYCQEELFDNLTVTCHIANPFHQGEQKTIKLTLDMVHFETHNLTDVEEKKVIIYLNVKSATGNHGIEQISIPLILRSNISTSVTGKTNQDSYYYLNKEKKTDMYKIEHVYNVFKHGSTPISEGLMLVQVPTVVNDSEPFLVMKNPRFQVLGAYYDCYTDGIPLESSTVSMGTSNDLVESHNKHRFINRLRKRRTDDRVTNELEFRNVTRSIQEFKRKDVVSIDCLNNRVKCGTVVCDLAALKSPQDIGTLTLSLTIKIQSLKTIFTAGNVIRLTTKAQIDIYKPLRNTSVEQVSTIFYNAKETGADIRKINGWIILLSVTIGLLILSVAILLLYYLGFFRKKQLEMRNYLNVNENVEINEQESEFERVNQMEENN